MPIDRDQLLSLWKLEELPACDVGMELVKAFLESCGRAVDTIQTANSNASIASVLAHWKELVAHSDVCDKCNEV